MSTQKTATKLRDNLPKFQGHAAFYRLDPPFVFTDGEETAHEFVIASACDTFDQGAETMVFPADKDGKVTSWLELDSQAGTLDHDDVLTNRMGYEIK